jgi:hypothetical protein
MGLMLLDFTPFVMHVLDEFIEDYEVSLWSFFELIEVEALL